MPFQSYPSKYNTLKWQYRSQAACNLNRVTVIKLQVIKLTIPWFLSINKILFCKMVLIHKKVKILWLIKYNFLFWNNNLRVTLLILHGNPHQYIYWFQFFFCELSFHFISQELFYFSSEEVLYQKNSIIFLMYSTHNIFHYYCSTYLYCNSLLSKLYA